MSGSLGTGIPAFVTAGARISGDLAAQGGTDLKALLPFDGDPLLVRILRCLRAVEGVGKIIVIGPKAGIENIARAAGADDVLEERSTGAENLFVGFEAYQEEIGNRHTLFAASDLPFLNEDVIRTFLGQTAGTQADIVYPIVPKRRFEEHYPGVPKTYARLGDGEMTGGSVMLMRAESILKNKSLIEKVYEARKSQIGMAQLLGWNFALRYVLGKLTVPEAESRASALTGCQCRAHAEADPRLAYDVDDTVDYNYALQRLKSGATGNS